MNNEAARFAAKSQGISGGNRYFDFAVSGLAIEGGSAVLDLGCGSGNFARYMRERRPCVVDGVDIVEYGGFDRGLYRNFQVWDLNQMKDLRLQVEYDFVFALGVVEYLENPRQFVRGAASLLKKGGRLVLTMPNPASLRSIVSLLAGGQFSQFKPPAGESSITPVLAPALARIFNEAGLQAAQIAFSNEGQWPMRTRRTYQSILPFLKGRLFSDNIRVTGVRA